jgi:ABC-type nitrate/sulfonate/bicarbonate transport system substrate-binding protein
MRRSFTLAMLLPIALFAAACGSDGDDDSAEPSPVTTAVEGSSEPSTDETVTDTTEVPPTDSMDVVAGEPFPEARCAANEAAGTINYFTGFDYAAAASILEVIVADELGYYEELCLDVVITPSFSTANYPLVAAGEAQFSSSGSFSELATQAASNDADLVAMSVGGHVAIDVLMVKPAQVASLGDLAGQAIGVKGAVPPAIAVMLQQEAALVEGDDFDTVLLEGFDPIAHWAIEDVAAVPGWRSNEPGALERAGETFELYDPGDFGIPGSFGIIYTSQSFLDEHPTAAEDFMRATMRALADAIADPDAASAMAVERINAGGNPNFLSPEGEQFRWATDAQAIVDTTPEGVAIGVPVAEELEAQIAAYAAVGVYGDDGAPQVDGRFDPDLVAGLYDADGAAIWPSS